MAGDTVLAQLRRFVFGEPLSRPLLDSDPVEFCVLLMPPGDLPIPTEELAILAKRAISMRRVCGVATASKILPDSLFTKLYDESAFDGHVAVTSRYDLRSLLSSLKWAKIQACLFELTSKDRMRTRDARTCLRDTIDQALKDSLVLVLMLVNRCDDVVQG